MSIEHVIRKLYDKSRMIRMGCTFRLSQKCSLVGWTALKYVFNLYSILIVVKITLNLVLSSYDFIYLLLLLVGVGEAANFIAYAFAPASLVSVLGVLSVLMTTILSSKYLKERLNFIGKVSEHEFMHHGDVILSKPYFPLLPKKLGCLLCTLGSTVIVIHAPMEKEIEDMAELQDKILNPIFIVYVNAAIALSVILIYHFRPKLPGLQNEYNIIHTSIRMRFSSKLICITYAVK